LVKFIAHRGNITGPNSSLENTDSYLKHAYSLGYDVEVDLLAHNGILYYGHDEPQETADISFLKNNGVWCHAKNLEALALLTNMNTNAFWHQTDTVTLTSKGYIWCYPGTFVDDSKAVWLDLLGAPLPETVKNIYGVCGDYIV
jgi:hypothetical protein